MSKYQIKFNASGETITDDGLLTILEIAEKNGIKIENSCRAGYCADCKVVCSGQVEMGKECKIEESYRKEGYIYTCCTRARSDLEIEL